VIRPKRVKARRDCTPPQPQDRRDCTPPPLCCRFIAAKAPLGPRNVKKYLTRGSEDREEVSHGSRNRENSPLTPIPLGKPAGGGWRSIPSTQEIGEVSRDPKKRASSSDLEERRTSSARANHSEEGETHLPDSSIPEQDAAAGWQQWEASLIAQGIVQKPEDIQAAYNKVPPRPIHAQEATSLLPAATTATSRLQSLKERQGTLNSFP
jgi:hypothetical protein